MEYIRARAIHVYSVDGRCRGYKPHLKFVKVFDGMGRWRERRRMVSAIATTTTTITSQQQQQQQQCYRMWKKIPREFILYAYFTLMTENRFTLYAVNFAEKCFTTRF